ncbi:unnamed protein product [Phaedon cochleariae]|uniref:Uncharacterized protein n=1 Tax=Phaedon cochleariae TaxID=80249 RepID=A0A9N9SMT7_PHACE|nr:unnamed protein product [Phaedon cochleariae]
MAGQGKSHDIDAPIKPCKRCRNIAQTGQKCIKCDTVTHFSCVKNLKNVIVLNSEEIVCCGSDIPVNDNNDGPFYDAKDEISHQENKTDYQVFNYIIKQKDVIISELLDKIDLLHKHIELISENNKLKVALSQNSKSANESTTSEIKSDTAKNNLMPVEQKPTAKSIVVNKTNKNYTGNSQTMKQSTDKKEKGEGNSQTTPTTTIRNTDVSLGLAREETRLKMNDYIHLNIDLNNGKSSQNRPNNHQLLNPEPNKNPSSSYENSKMTNPSHQGHGNEWEQVRNRRGRKHRVIIGKNTENNLVKGVPKFTTLHVSRINKDTTSEALTELLHKHFPEATCEAMNSRYPDSYSSFKVKIRNDNFNKAMDPEVWPYGTCISRFLERRRQTTPMI